jgi:hypothetical protein
MNHKPKRTTWPSQKRIGNLKFRFLFIVYFLFFSTTIVFSQDTTTEPDYFAEAVVDNPTPYVGQQIIYRFRFYDAVDVTNPQYEAPDFEGFWRIDKKAINNSSLMINNRQYTVTELYTALYPTHPGVIEISPATVLLPETVFHPEENLTANTVSVDVKPLPENAPPGFSGAVGQFNLTATLDRQSALLGEPFVVRLSIAGTGNIEQLTLPDLPTPADWRVYANPTIFTVTDTDELIIGEKVYEYLLIPGQVGEQTLPGITFDYFDPVTELYRSANTEPVTLDILPPSPLNLQPSLSPIENGSVAVATPLPLKPITSALQIGMVNQGVFFWLLWLLPPLGAGVCWWWIWQQKRNKLRDKMNRRSVALEQAQARLRKLSKTTSSENYHAVRLVVLKYFADKLSYIDKDLSETDLEKVLIEANISPNLGKRILLCLEWADEGQYAAAGSVDLLTLIIRTSETLIVLDNGWKLK